MGGGDLEREEGRSCGGITFFLLLPLTRLFLICIDYRESGRAEKKIHIGNIFTLSLRLVSLLFCFHYYYYRYSNHY